MLLGMKYNPEIIEYYFSLQQEYKIRWSIECLQDMGYSLSEWYGQS